MIDVFNLKIGDRLIYRIPEKEKDEKIKRYDGHIVEVTNIHHVFHPETFDATLIFLVRDEVTGEERALDGKYFHYLEYVQYQMVDYHYDETKTKCTVICKPIDEENEFLISTTASSHSYNDFKNKLMSVMNERFIDTYHFTNDDYKELLKYFSDEDIIDGYPELSLKHLYPVEIDRRGNLFVVEPSTTGKYGVNYNHVSALFCLRHKEQFDYILDKIKELPERQIRICSDGTIEINNKNKT